MVFPRLITALVGAPLFLWALYLGSLPFLVFTLLVIFLTLWEFHRMAEAGGYATQSWASIAAGVFVALVLGVPGVRESEPFLKQAPSAVLVIVLFFLLLREIFRRDKSLSMLRLSVSFLGIFLVVWPLAHMMLLRNLRGMGTLENFQLGRNALLFLTLLIWSQDVASWGVGLLIGRHRMAVHISPKKSWEGAVAGWAVAVMVAFILREVWLKSTFSRGEAVILGAVLGGLAQLSDLVESLVKRCFGVKDSSDLLPGHGGVFDRFDSFLLSTPFLYFYLVFWGRTG